MEESKRERVGGGKEVLSPSLPNPTLSPFFLAHFSLRFPNYLKACYRLTTCLPSFPTFYGIYSAWASSTFGTLLLISRNRFGSTNFSTAFRLRFFFFLVSFLSFFLCHFLSYFLDLFSILSPVSLTSPLPRRAPSAPDKRERPFCFAPDHYLDYSAKIEYNTKPTKNLVTNEWEHLKGKGRLEDFPHPP